MLFIIIISSLRAFRRARDSEAKGRVDWKRSRWPDAKFEVAGAKCALRNDRSPAQSFARSLTHSLAREKREERGSRPRKTTTTRRREKREERREKSEERRERREETREKTEDRPQEAARGPQMRPPEGGQPFSWPCRPLVGPLAASRAEGREQRKERREKRQCFFFCFSWGARGGASQG